MNNRENGVSGIEKKYLKSIKYRWPSSVPTAAIPKNKRRLFDKKCELATAPPCDEISSIEET